MRAILVHEYGGPEVLQLSDVPQPEPATGEVRLRIQAAGLNYADLHQRMGEYALQPPFPFTPGLEAVGLVDALGPGVHGVALGQRMAVLAQGCYAEAVCAPANRLFPVPDALDAGAATALLVQGLTALGLLHDAAPGSTVLVQAAAGGVGSLAVQVGKLLGLRVIGLASAGKLAAVTALGADAAIDYNLPDWPQQVRAANHDRRVDRVLDMVGGDTTAQSLELLARGGTLLVFGMASRQPTLYPLQQLIFRHQTVRGYYLTAEAPAMLAEHYQRLVHWALAGKLQLPTQAFPLAQAAQAHAAVAARQTTGKVFLRVG